MSVVKLRRDDDASTAIIEPAGTQPRLVDGLTFALDAISGDPAIWGAGDDVLWPMGEPFLIVGPDGSGKTTLAQQLVFALLEIGDDRVLGYPVTPADRGVLYLAADRPKQGARSMWRRIRDDTSTHRKLREGLLVWRGPPPFSVVKEPERLAEWSLKVGASVLVLDSLGFIVPELSRDESGSAIAAAFATCAARGVEVLALTHGRKAQAENRKPRELADVFGSRWITSACGSVLSLWGNAGDPVLELRHLKQPAGEVGPLMVELDRQLGKLSVVAGSDLLGALRASSNGLSAREAGRLMDGASDKAREVKARRKLDRLVADERAYKREGESIRGSITEAARYFATPHPAVQGTLG